MLDDEGAMLFVEGTKPVGQEIDRLAGDVTVDVEPPGDRAHGQQQNGDQEREQRSAWTHDGILTRLDNITHTLVGIMLVRAGVGRRTPGATAAMVIASNAPDLDIISAITGGAVPYLAAHRGPTHGVLGVLGLALVSALIVWSVQRVRGGRNPSRRSAG